MAQTAPQPMIDPLYRFIAGTTEGRGYPVPLVATRFEIDIEAGLATVAMHRTFRNIEAESIEATLTFPVPVHAVLYGLTARIAGRVVVAQAQPKAAARETYEDAIERGKAAVLHEEVLRGIHMLSVAHVPPEQEIEVSAHWAMTPTALGDLVSLRIPLTVGDVYGRSGLPDSDDLVHGGATGLADLVVRSADGPVTLRGQELRDGRAAVPLDAPIDLELPVWTVRPIHGRAADGRVVTLTVTPSRDPDGAVDAAIVIDHSGSMGSLEDGARLTKHQAVLAGLRSIAEILHTGEHLDLWEFDDVLGHVGSTRDAGASLPAMLRRLTEPRGGTEIGSALTGAIAQTVARDILLVTDGKSHALDVQGLARTGRRFTVVLVGEDSLEANVGHLAALTGGEIFVSAGADLTEALVAALRSLRRPRRHLEDDSDPAHVNVLRAGMVLTAGWSVAEGEALAGSRAAAALAASLALPRLDAEAATSLAVAEGLVTHLTSMILVDEEGAAQPGLPAQRKVALPTPRAGPVAVAGYEMPRGGSPVRPSTAYRIGEIVRAALSAPPPDAHALRTGSADTVQGRNKPVPQIARGRIAWEQAPARLAAGDLSLVDDAVRAAMRRAAALPEIVALARRMGRDPILLVIGLLARREARANRSAARIAKLVLGGWPARELDDAMKAIDALEE